MENTKKATVLVKIGHETIAVHGETSFKGKYIQGQGDTTIHFTKYGFIRLVQSENILINVIENNKTIDFENNEEIAA
jgi:hypothetical protein